MNNKSKMKVYYNSACPVCKAGIESQKTKESVCAIQWSDVHSDNALVNGINSELEFVRKRLHVVDDNGALQVGFNAFLAIWRNSSKEKWKAAVFGLPVIKQFCIAAYNAFAFLLYRWNRAMNHW